MLIPYQGHEVEVEELLDDVVLEFANADKSFTAYDVTVEARKRTNVEFSHRDVANYIHSAIRTLASHYSVRQHQSYQAREYFNPTPKAVFPPAGKLSRSGAGAVIAALVTAPIAPPTQAQVNAPNALSTTASPRSEGRVLVPSSLMKYIGAKPGTIVSVEIQPGQIFVGLNGVVSQDKTYMADKYTNIRLTKRTLKKAGLAGKDVVLLACNNDTIRITKK